MTTSVIQALPASESLQHRALEPSLVGLSMQDYVATAEQLSQGLTLSSPEGWLVYCNSQFLKVWRLPHRLAHQRTPWRTLVSARHTTQLLVDKPMPSAVPGQAQTQLLEWLLHDARTIAVTNVMLPSGLTLGLHVDVTALRWAQQQAHLRATHPTATGLPAAASLALALQTALARNQPGHEIALMHLDVRLRNTTPGSAQAVPTDLLLRQVSTRLRQSTRESDICAHLGQGGFAVLQTGTVQPGGAMKLSQRLQSTLTQPFQCGAATQTLAVNIGIALAPFDAEDGETLLACAQRALQAAATVGTDQIKFHEAGT